MGNHLEVQPGIALEDDAGSRATVIAIDRSGTEELVLVRLPDDSELSFPISLLQQRKGGIFFSGEFASLSGAAPETQREDPALVIPVIEEFLTLEKKKVETGRGVRITKSVDVLEELVDLPLQRDEIIVEHVPRDILLAEGETRERREEGDTVIIPVLEEVLVVQKRLRLREEIHITRRRHETHAPQRVQLRKEVVNVEQINPDKLD
ncbi:MAG: hypothetical protein JWP36_2731 [Paucimonas sp.]|nr:hypothetical protein [Paucimonas sp.]